MARTPTPWIAVLVGLALARPSGAAAGTTPETEVTIWASTGAAAMVGGVGYGGDAPTTGAMVSGHHEVAIQDGEIRIVGVARTLEPASVQLRDLTDPRSAITQQRFERGAATPTELLQRHVGARITVVTPSGEQTGVLRSADAHTLVLETGTGDQRRLQVMRRDGFAQEIRLPAGTTVDQPSLTWRVTSRQPGPHRVALTYRADGLTWHADYLAVIDERTRTAEFSAWATVRNLSGASFDPARVTLIGAARTGPPATSPPGTIPVRVAVAPASYAIAAPVALPAGQAVQVELVPAMRAAKTRAVITFEAMPDPSLGFQAYPNTDCSQFNGVGAGTGRSERALEVELARGVALPEGRIRAFRRAGDRLEIVSEDQLRASVGVARIRASAEPQLVGERRAVSCNYDERTRTVTEKVEVRVENRTRQAADVVIREYAWRWPLWRLEAEDVKSVRAGAQTLEYRVQVPAGAKRTVTYGVAYAW